MSQDELFVDVKQFLRPGGRINRCQVKLSGEFRGDYEQMSEVAELQAEVLTTGEISITVFHLESGQDIDIRVVPNGPQVLAAIEDMLHSRSWTHVLDCRNG